MSGWVWDFVIDTYSSRLALGAKDLVWNCQTPAILWFSRIDRDPRLLSPTHVVPLKKQKNMPDLMGKGLARDEAMNHGQWVIYCILCLVSDIELTESFYKKS